MSRRQKATAYRTITREAVRELRRLRKEYPELGHEGLLPLLAEAGHEVDETELREFMESNHLNPGEHSIWMPNPLGRFRHVPAPLWISKGDDEP